MINPATEEVTCSVCEATEKDVDIAVAAARKAFEGEWRRVTPQQRGLLLLKLADLCEKNMDLLTAVEALDNGKSFTMARIDINGVIGTIRYYGGWADKIEGKTIDISPDMLHYTRREPVSIFFLFFYFSPCSDSALIPGSSRSNPNPVWSPGPLDGITSRPSTSSRSLSMSTELICNNRLASSVKSFHGTSRP